MSERIVWSERFQGGKCMHCGSCIAICPEGVLRIEQTLATHSKIHPNQKVLLNFVKRGTKRHG